MRILAVDISGLFSQKWLVDNGRGQDYNQPRLSTIHAVRKFREGHDRVAICCDSGKSFRTQLWDTYKADREDRGEPYRAQLGQTLEALSQDGCSVFRAPKYAGDLYAEADDVIGSLCQWAYESGHEVTILSADKDLMQLVGNEVKQISPLEKDPVVYGSEEVKAKLGVLPPLVPHLLALAGDSSDNYKPYPRVGPKLAAMLLEKYGHATAVFAEPVDMAALTQILGPKLADAVVGAGPEPARKALKVATIVRDLPLDFERLTGEPVRTPLPDEQEMTKAPTMEPQPTGEAPQEEKAETALEPVQPKQPELTKAEAAQSVERAVSNQMASFPGAPYWMQPGFVTQLWRVATAFYQAGLFPNFANAQQIMTVGMMAYEDGIGIATALQHAYPVYGRLCWSATYLLMRAESSGTVETFDVVTSTEKECSIKCKRKGRAEKIVKFTIEEAARAQLVKAGGNWVKWPTEMLLARCIARALRQEWRDKVGGRYVPEEMDSPISDDEILSNAREVRRALTDKTADALQAAEGGQA